MIVLEINRLGTYARSTTKLKFTNIRKAFGSHSGLFNQVCKIVVLKQIAAEN